MFIKFKDTFENEVAVQMNHIIAAYRTPNMLIKILTKSGPTFEIVFHNQGARDAAYAELTDSTNKEKKLWR